MNRALAVALVALAACTETVQLDNRLAGLVSLSVAPADTTLTIDGLDAPPQTVAFTATGAFSDGSTRDVTALVTWSVDNAAPGAIAAGTYTTTDAAGGHVHVIATTQGVTAGATLTVVISASLVDATFPPPGSPTTLFPPGAQPITGDAMHSPSVLYPSDGTMFPQGVAATLVQYAPGMANDSFRIGLDNDVLHLAVYSGAARWSADGELWALVAASGIADPIALAVEATDSSAPGTVYASAPIALDFSRDAPGGVIYYWSSATSGVMRGALGSESATKLYPATTTCVGCHAVSRDASAMAMGFGDENNPMLQTIAVATLATVIDAGQGAQGGWSTYSPDGSMLLVAHAGMLTLRDAHTGAGLGAPNGAVMLPPMTFATHPDWSPDGSAVAVALTKMAPNDKDVNGASIALLPFAAGAFGAPQVLVASTAMDNNYFPRWSPDGKYVAFVHATMSSHGASSAELRLVPAAGGTPIVLAAASGTGQFDTMPVWAPAQGELSWLAFATVRPYGAVLAMPTPMQAQIWIAGVDPTRAGDPSFAAFWLPGQDVTALDNNPVWSSPTEVDAR